MRVLVWIGTQLMLGFIRVVEWCRYPTFPWRRRQ